jgi:hypothetical protein
MKAPRQLDRHSGPGASSFVIHRSSLEAYGNLRKPTVGYLPFAQPGSENLSQKKEVVRSSFGKVLVKLSKEKIAAP